MSLNMGLDEAKCSRGFGGKANTSVKVSSHPGGSSSLNLYIDPDTEPPTEHVISPCQVERNKSSVFEEGPVRERKTSIAQLERNKSRIFEDDEDQEEAPRERRTSIRLIPRPPSQSEPEYRPSTKVKNPPGGASSITFG